MRTNWRQTTLAGLACVILLLLSRPCFAEGKLYALLVFDTNADRIGRAVEKDRDTIMKILYKTFDRDGRRHRVEWTILDGDNVSPERILKYYSDLTTTKEDTMFFYYSGHGGLDEDGEHYLATSGGSLRRSLLRGAINYQDQRLAVMITDCCASRSTTAGDVRALDPNDVNPLADEEGGNWQTVKQLFFGGSGFVDINSSEPGQTSRCNDRVGSYYTSAFAYTLCREPNDLDDDGDVTWSRFLARVDSQVEDSYVPKDVQFSYDWYLNEWPKHR